MSILNEELERFENVKKVIVSYSRDRKEQLSIQDNKIKELEKERLESVSWREKNDLTAKMMEQSAFDPRKYLTHFEFADSPYFGVVKIKDSDKKIGEKEYILGKQSLLDGSKVVIVDWRQAAVSRFFYDYEEGEEYDEEICDKERTGNIVYKRKITISNGILLKIDTSSSNYLYQNKVWINSNENMISNIVSEMKELNGEHHLIDIIPLISAEQFKLITDELTGTVYLTGGAGSGKTTVALHRLSYLKYNYPKVFKEDKCMVLMFNRTLRDYVSKTSEELLGNVPVHTFNSWALQALGSFGYKHLKFYTDSNKHDCIKKDSKISILLNKFVKENKFSNNLLKELGDFYSSEDFLSYFKTTDSEDYIYFKNWHTDGKLSYSDAGILLRLCQLRSNTKTVPKGFNWYEHVTIDEAQDLSQVELECIYNAVNDKKNLTICADRRQKILGFVDGTGLTNFCKEIKLNDKDNLTIGYRSAKGIMEVANALRNNEKIKKPEDGSVIVIKEKNEKKQIERLKKIISDIKKESPNSLTAIICKAKKDIAKLYDFFAEDDFVRMPSEISFEPGVIIINAHQVKGLEFTNVFLWDNHISKYSNNEVDKNLLYVSVTRACKKLYLFEHEKSIIKFS